MNINLCLHRLRTVLPVGIPLAILVGERLHRITLLLLALYENNKKAIYLRLPYLHQSMSRHLEHLSKGESSNRYLPIFGLCGLRACYVKPNE